MAIIGVALARDADTAQRVVIQFACTASTAVNDVVFQSSGADQSVEPFVNNTVSNQALGICIEKINATTCKVLLLGIATGFSGLTRGARIFLSTTGTLSPTKPPTGYLQNLGIATSSTEAMFIPNNIKVLQI